MLVLNVLCVIITHSLFRISMFRSSKEVQKVIILKLMFGSAFENYVPRCTEIVTHFDLLSTHANVWWKATVAPSAWPPTLPRYLPSIPRICLFQNPAFSIVSTCFFVAFPCPISPIQLCPMLPSFIATILGCSLVTNGLPCPTLPCLFGMQYGAKVAMRSPRISPALCLSSTGQRKSKSTSQIRKDM